MRADGELERTGVGNDLLPRIARHLIMHASYTPDMGLYHGKMGIVLFFAHYARYMGNSLYNEFAGELLDEVYQGIHTELPVNFESGLCGVGWGIEYLLQYGFMEGDSDEILSRYRYPCYGMRLAKDNRPKCANRISRCIILYR